jgi:hypothetical protein
MKWLRASPSGLWTMAAWHEWWDDRRRLPLEAAADHDLDCLVGCRSLLPSFHLSFLPSISPSFLPSLLPSFHLSFLPSISPSFLSRLHTLNSLQKHRSRTSLNHLLFALTHGPAISFLLLSFRSKSRLYQTSHQLRQRSLRTSRSKTTRCYLCELRDQVHISTRIHQFFVLIPNHSTPSCYPTFFSRARVTIAL